MQRTKLIGSAVSRKRIPLHMLVGVFGILVSAAIKQRRAGRIEGRIMNTKSPDPIDKYVGGRVRARRHMLGMTQEKLGHALKLTFQQVQKYEKGSNRIGASRLQQIAQILQVPVAFFFDGAPRVTGQPNSGDAPSPEFVSKFLATPDGLALTRAFTRLEDSKLRRSIVALAQAIVAREALKLQRR